MSDGSGEANRFERAGGKRRPARTLLGRRFVTPCGEDRAAPSDRERTRREWVRRLSTHRVGLALEPSPGAGQPSAVQADGAGRDAKLTGGFASAVAFGEHLSSSAFARRQALQPCRKVDAEGGLVGRPVAGVGGQQSFPAVGRCGGLLFFSDETETVACLKPRVCDVAEGTLVRSSAAEGAAVPDGAAGIDGDGDDPDSDGIPAAAEQSHPRRPKVAVGLGDGFLTQRAGQSSKLKAEGVFDAVLRRAVGTVGVGGGAGIDKGGHIGALPVWVDRPRAGRSERRTVPGGTTQ
jgi:hypothetical protein